MMKQKAPEIIASDLWCPFVYGAKIKEKTQCQQKRERRQSTTSGTLRTVGAPGLQQAAARAFDDIAIKGNKETAKEKIQ